MKPKLNPAYSDTVFQDIPADAPCDFWVITAHNPDGKSIDPLENERADGRLLEDIKLLGVTPFRVTGTSPDGMHAEPGWGFPSDEDTALVLGRHYRQEAVFHFTSGCIDLVDCRDGQRHAIETPDRHIIPKASSTGSGT